MTERDKRAEPEVLFDALLRPHRSLAPAGFAVLMTAVAVALAGVGIAFFMIGAWPVLGFCGLEVALVYLFFKLNFRDLRRYETLTLTGRALVLRRVAPDGASETESFPPHWLRVVLEPAPGDSNRLRLGSHGRYVSVGGFLTPAEREELAAALKAALARQCALPA